MSLRILVTGSAGQIGAELVPRLRGLYGNENVVAGLHKASGIPLLKAGPMEVLDVGDKSSIDRIVAEHKIDTIFHLAALLSATAESNPQLAWQVNVDGLKNVLEVARLRGLSKVFWPSSIAVFGPDAPRTHTPQNSPLNPSTIYGVTKVAGELLCNYYFGKYGLDVRVLRYPGLISSEAPPGGGTTDYAVEIFYAAITRGTYTCFLREDTVLPMMYMPDAIDATVSFMTADEGRVKRHLGYNLAAVSFSPAQIAAEIRKHIPKFSVEFAPDSRQKIADSWPMSVDDSEARRDWGWMHAHDLSSLTTDMISKLSPRLKAARKDV